MRPAAPPTAGRLILLRRTAASPPRIRLHPFVAADPDPVAPIARPDSVATHRHLTDAARAAPPSPASSTSLLRGSGRGNRRPRCPAPTPDHPAGVTPPTAVVGAASLSTSPVPILRLAIHPEPAALPDRPTVSRRLPSLSLFRPLATVAVLRPARPRPEPTRSPVRPGPGRTLPSSLVAAAHARHPVWPGSAALLPGPRGSSPHHPRPPAARSPPRLPAAPSGLVPLGRATPAPVARNRKHQRPFGLIGH